MSALEKFALAMFVAFFVIPVMLLLLSSPVSDDEYDNE